MRNFIFTYTQSTKALKTLAQLVLVAFMDCECFTSCFACVVHTLYKCKVLIYSSMLHVCGIFKSFLVCYFQRKTPSYAFINTIKSQFLHPLSLWMLFTFEEVSSNWALMDAIRLMQLYMSTRCQLFNNSFHIFVLRIIFFLLLN